MGSAREHADLKNRIRIALNQRNDCHVFNNEQGLAEHAGGSMVRYGVGKGGTDLIGLVSCRYDDRTIARWFGIEVKTGDAVLEPKQRQHAQMVRGFGGYACVARSVDEALWHVQKCKEGFYGDE